MYSLLFHGLVVFHIFILLLLLGLDDVQKGEDMVLALPPDLLATWNTYVSGWELKFLI